MKSQHYYRRDALSPLDNQNECDESSSDSEAEYDYSKPEEGREEMLFSLVEDLII